MLFIFGRMWFESSNVDWEQKKSFRTFAFSSLLVMGWLLSNKVEMMDDEFLFVSWFAVLNHSFAETLLELILLVRFLLYSCFDFLIYLVISFLSFLKFLKNSLTCVSYLNLLNNVLPICICKNGTPRLTTHHVYKVTVSSNITITMNYIYLVSKNLNIELHWLDLELRRTIYLLKKTDT